MEECVRMMQQTLRAAPSVKKRAKSVYSQRNLGTIKHRKKEKQQEKEEKSNAAMQLEKVKVERDMALKQIDILKDQVGQLQAQNTKLVAQLGKLGALASANDLAVNGMVPLEDGKLSQASSRSK